MKILIIALMLLVLYCLGSASYYMLRSQDSVKMAKALTWRIGLSILIFALLFVAYAAGWVHPHELMVSPN